MQNLTIYRAKMKSTGHLVYGYPFEDITGKTIMYQGGRFPQVEANSLAKFSGYHDANNDPIFENDTVYLSIEDSIEPTGKARVKGKVVFYKGCWVFQQDGFDYSKSAIYYFNFMHQINQSDLHLSKSQKSILKSSNLKS